MAVWEGTAVNLWLADIVGGVKAVVRANILGADQSIFTLADLAVAFANPARAAFKAVVQVTVGQCAARDDEHLGIFPVGQRVGLVAHVARRVDVMVGGESFVEVAQLKVNVGCAVGRARGSNLADLLAPLNWIANPDVRWGLHVQVERVEILAVPTDSRVPNDDHVAQRVEVRVSRGVDDVVDNAVGNRPDLGPADVLARKGRTIGDDVDTKVGPLTPAWKHEVSVGAHHRPVIWDHRA